MVSISLNQAINALNNGEVIAVPTETVYGLAAALDQSKAIEQIFSLKKRPLENPLIIHVAGIEHIRLFGVDFPPFFHELAQTFWPGPLTLILPVQISRVPSIVRAGLTTAGFRVPAHPLTLELIKRTGPLVMPSANLSGKPSATCLEHVQEDFGLEFPVLDGGMCQKGLESTILYYRENEWVIVRLGALPSVQFESILGYQPQVIKKESGKKTLCPGQSFRHYAPNAKLVLTIPSLCPDDAVILGFDERNYPSKNVWRMGSLLDPAKVAENLYHLLRRLDQEKITLAWIDMNFPRQGLWNTIAERLERASEG